MVVRGDIGEASGGISPGAQGPAKLLDFTLIREEVDVEV